ncbi:hypothetical protein [Maribacter halichondriae]|uniref:hypothetical protein n=1 Tax=Maribacter halichondriae TaxID=2980554 RepID=UPI0023581359|nr:hypothetical protein [Maribacter sp. Hal144]
MRSFTKHSLFLFLFMMGTLLVSAQTQTVNGDTEKKEKLKVQRHTVMERFEPELVISVEDRIQLKEDRIITLQRTKQLLDTLDISDRKRRKLIRDLKRSPVFSERLVKVIAETKFEDDIENPD